MPSTPHVVDAPLPPPLRVARWAELAFVPVAGITAMGLPFPSTLGGAVAVGLIVAEVALAYYVFRHLRVGSRPAWWIALFLSVFVLSGFLMRGPALIRAVAEGGQPALAWGLAIAGWLWGTQLVVLVCCLLTMSWVRRAP